MKDVAKHFANQFCRLPALMLVVVWAVSGCSGSGDPQSSDDQQTTMDTAIPVASDNDLSNSATNQSEADTITEVVTEENPGDPEFPDSSNPIDVDTLTENKIFVNFDITVPVYQSNELSLSVGWGDLNLDAGWVGDEFWTVSSELPTETEELLTVTFYDKNGAIELASFSQQFRTGLNATEAFQITADQFDTDQFDDDGDGVSNLDELIAGNDPTVDEASILEIEDSFLVTGSLGFFVTADLESLLSEERPISSTTQEQVSFSVTVDTDIQIDINGNGTLTRDRKFSCETDITTGVRSNLGNAISWEASRIHNDCDFTLQGNLTNTITVIDEKTRAYAEEVDGKRYGSFTNDWQMSTNLTGELVDETSLCKPVAGTHSSSRTYRNDGHVTSVTFVSKEIDEAYWRVETEITRRNFYTDPVEVTVLETSEYFARELDFGAYPVPENPELFICDFVDI